MQRPKLEIASWIAGVIGAIVAVVALAYQLRLPTQPSGETPRAVQPPAAQASGAVSHTPAAPPQAEILTEYRKRLHAGLEAAKRLNSYRDRDEAILQIAKSAIRDDYYMFAFQASRSLNGYVARDAVAEAVTCHLAHRGENEDARTVALAIGDYRIRDSSLGRISYLATVRPGEGENSYSCDVSMGRIK